MKPRH